jgi:hypothetical protein
MPASILGGPLPAKTVLLLPQRHRCVRSVAWEARTAKIWSCGRALGQERAAQGVRHGSC